MVPIDYFDVAAERFADRTAIVDRDVSLSYRQLQWLTHLVAAQLAGDSAGGQSSPVALFSPNDYRVLIAALAAMRVGRGVVPLHSQNRLEVNALTLRTVGPRSAYYHSSLSNDVERLRQSNVGVDSWHCLDTIMPAENHYEWRASAPDWIQPDGNPTTPVYYWSTSGSAGEPKIVVDTCGSFLPMLMTMRAWHSTYTSHPVSLIVAPMSHSGGPHAVMMLTLGATVVVARTFDPAEITCLIERYKVTDIWLPPTALYLLIESPDARRRDLSSLRTVQMGMAGAAPERIREAVALLGPCVSHTYGQIETGLVTMLDPATVAAAVSGHFPERLKSSGTTTFLNRFGIMSEDGRLLALKQEGEVVVRGQSVKPYLDHDMTVQARRYGWHHTGDIGFVDDCGFLYLVARIRDVINTSGFKVPAAQVEQAIMELPSIRECAVVAVPDPIRGEVAKAVVTLRTGATFEPAAIIEHCRQRVARGAPVSVTRWEALPRSPAGKIDKRRIRDSLR